MRVAFVTPRYGPRIVGGAESAARQLAEHLVADMGWEVEVFTSCALDHLTWQNELAPGDTTLAGVVVHRFRAHGGRDPDFYSLDARLRGTPARASLEDAERWVELNGPVTPELVDALCESGAQAAVFYPYLYYPSVKGIERAPMPTVLHPAAHDEPALYLRVFRSTFESADAITFHTAAERQLVQDLYQVSATPQLLLGLGIDPPTPPRQAGGAIAGIGERPYLVSVGRVDEHKGSKMLARYFVEYKRRRPGPLGLVFVGPLAYHPPKHPDIVCTGVVSEEEKYDLLRAAQALVSASAFESFSLVVYEAATVGLPVVVNARCGPTNEFCERSGGGIGFGSYPEFEVVLDRLLADARLRHELGEHGRAYVERHFRWPVLLDRYARFLEQVVARGKRAALSALV